MSDDVVKISGLTHAEFFKRPSNQWFLACLYLAEGLLESVKQTHIEEETNSYITHCESDLKKLYMDLNIVIQNLNNLLPSISNKPMIRRQIVRLYREKFKDFSKIGTKNLNYIMELLKDNLMEEPDNEKNIYLWFQVARHHPNVTLDDAIEYLSAWSSRTNQVQALYYYYVLMVLKGMEGYEFERSRAKRLIEACAKEAEKSPYKTFCFEWFGIGEGLQSLVHHRMIDEAGGNQLRTVRGIVTEYKHPGNGKIEVNGFEVFFKPGQAKGITKDSLNKEVELQFGFSYDGLRAKSKSVRALDYLEENMPADDKKTAHKKTQQAQEETAFELAYKIKGKAAIRWLFLSR